MAVGSKSGYDQWLEREGTATVFIYSALVAVLLPAFHYVLSGFPVARPDSLTLRLAGAAISVAVAALVWLAPPVRPYAFRLQLINLLPTLLIILALIVNSGNNPFYVTSGLLAVVGLQQAFFRVRDIVFAFTVGLVFQIGYSFYMGYGHDRVNTMVILIYASAYAIALFPSVVAIRSRERALRMRLSAEAARAEVATQLSRQTVITRIVEYIRSTFDLQAVLESVVQALGPHVAADRICVALWDDRTQTMTVRGEYRRDPITVPSLLGTELKSVRWAKFYRRLLSGHSVHIADVAHADLARSQREFFRLSDTREFLATPIHAQNRRQLLGFLGVGLTSADRQLTSEDETFLEAIAGQVGLAIQQSRVYEQLQEELDYRRRQEARLSDLANRDALTGLFNRRYFIAEAQRCVERCSAETARGALFFLDLDRFKIVNDTLGHDAGDRVLMAVPKVIRGALREFDLLARIGGDEFAVLLPDMPQSETLRVAEKIRKSIAGYSFREGGRVFDLGVSIGVALIDGTTPAQELMNHADEACYRAKADGRNTVQLWSNSTFG